MADTPIPDRTPPTWQQVRYRQDEPWDRKHPVLDTAAVPARRAVSMIPSA